MPRWVANASPVIVLARIGRADWLSVLSEGLVIPAAVVAEIQAGPSHDPARAWLLAHRDDVRTVDADSHPVVAAWDLGAGESATLAYAAAHPGHTAILDDAAARACARTLGVGVKGTLGVVIKAKQTGLVPAATPVMHELLAVGWRIDSALLAAALRRIGE